MAKKVSGKKVSGKERANIAKATRPAKGRVAAPKATILVGTPPKKGAKYPAWSDKVKPGKSAKVAPKPDKTTQQEVRRIRPDNPKADKNADGKTDEVRESMTKAPAKKAAPKRPKGPQWSKPNEVIDDDPLGVDSEPTTSQVAESGDIELDDDTNDIADDDTSEPNPPALYDEGTNDERSDLDSDGDMDDDDEDMD